MDIKWLTANDFLACYIKSRARILGRFKGAGSTSIQGPHYYEGEIVVLEKVPSSTERPSVRELRTNGNREPIYQVRNDGSTNKIQ